MVLFYVLRMLWNMSTMRSTLHFTLPASLNYFSHVWFDISFVFIYNILHYSSSIALHLITFLWSDVSRAVVCQSGRTFSTSMLNKWLTTALWLQTVVCMMHWIHQCTLYLVNQNEQQIWQLENKLDNVCSQLYDHKEKHEAHDKRVEDDKYKSLKYCTLFWLILILYVPRIMIPTVIINYGVIWNSSIEVNSVSQVILARSLLSMLLSNIYNAKTKRNACTKFSGTHAYNKY
jgi:hypothetical protein